MLQNDSVETNWVTTDAPIDKSTEDDASINLDSSVPSATSESKTPALVEAQGWSYGSNSKVILTAQAPTTTLQSFSQTPAPASWNAY